MYWILESKEYLRLAFDSIDRNAIRYVEAPRPKNATGAAADEKDRKTGMLSKSDIQDQADVLHCGASQILENRYQIQ
jgi:hypothetical protein